MYFLHITAFKNIFENYWFINMLCFTYLIIFNLFWLCNYSPNYTYNVEYLFLFFGNGVGEFYQWIVYLIFHLFPKMLIPGKAYCTCLDIQIYSLIIIFIFLYLLSYIFIILQLYSLFGTAPAVLYQNFSFIDSIYPRKIVKIEAR